MRLSGHYAPQGNRKLKRPQGLPSLQASSQSLQKTCVSLLRLFFPLVPKRQHFFTYSLCELLQLLHAVANTRPRRLVAVPVELLEVACHRGDELLQLREAARRGRGRGLSGLGFAGGPLGGALLPA